MSISTKLERKIDDLILAFTPIPGADMEVIEVAEGILGINIIPGAQPVAWKDLSIFQKLMLVIPLIDLEYLDILGINVFSDAEKAYQDRNKEPELDDLNQPRTQGQDNGRRGRDQGGMRRRNSNTPPRRRGGNQVVTGNEDDDEGINLGSVKGTIKKAFFVTLIAGVLLGTGTFVSSSLSPSSGSTTQTDLAASTDTIGQVAGSSASRSVDQGSEFIQRQTGYVKCLGSSPVSTLTGDNECVQEWKSQNSERPDSNDVGERYGLVIDRFSITGSESGINVGSARPDEEIPVTIVVRNPIRGIKGIEAKNVEYKLRMTDSEHEGEDEYCDTGWLPLRDTDSSGEPEDIPPGGTVFKRSIQVSESSEGDPFTHESCRMLTPGAGDDRTVQFFLRYEYFSQATLYFQAMSTEELESEDITRKFTNSQTADTPAQAALSATQPVTFRSGYEGENRKTFEVQGTVTTEKEDVDYFIRDLKMVDSTLTQPLQGDRCDFETQSSQQGSQSLRPDDFTKQRLQENADGDAKFYSEDRPPNPFSCEFRLNEYRQISNSGETLDMDLLTNYTIIKSSDQVTFEAYNRRCSSEQNNCPFVFPVQGPSSSDLARLSDPYQVNSENPLYWSLKEARCTGPSASDGCTAVSSEQYRDLLNREINEYDGSKIRDGEIAVQINQEPSDLIGKCGQKAVNTDETNRNIIGLDYDEYFSMKIDQDAVITYSPDQSTEGYDGFEVANEQKEKCGF
jgi:hypothetical protein